MRAGDGELGRGCRGQEFGRVGRQRFRPRRTRIGLCGDFQRARQRFPGLHVVTANPRQGQIGLLARGDGKAEAIQIGLKLRSPAGDPALGGGAINKLGNDARLDDGGRPARRLPVNQPASGAGAARRPQRPSRLGSQLYPRNPAQRELLFKLDTARRQLFARKGQSTEFDLMLKSVANLLRMWSVD